MYEEQIAKRMMNGESIEDMAKKAEELTRNIETLLKNIQCLCDDTGHDIVEASSLSVVCQVNVGASPRCTLVIGNGTSVKHAVKSLITALEKNNDT